MLVSMQMHQCGQFDFGYFSLPNTGDTQVDSRCLESLEESSLELMNTLPDSYFANNLDGPYSTWKNFQNSPEDPGIYCFGNANGLESSTLMHPAFPMVIPEPEQWLQAAGNPDNQDNSGGITEEASKECKSNDAQTQSRRRRVSKVKSAQREFSRLTKLVSDLQMENKQLKLKISLQEAALPKADALIELMTFKKTHDLKAQNAGALVGSEPVSCLKNLRLSIFTPLSHGWPNYEELKAIERLTSEEFCAIYSKLIMECSLALAHDALREKCGYPHAPTSTALLCGGATPVAALESERRFPNPHLIPHYSVFLNFLNTFASLNPDAMCIAGARSWNLHTNRSEEPGEEFWDAVLGNLDLTEEQVSLGIAASNYALKRLERQDPHRNELIRKISDKLHVVCQTNNFAVLSMGSDTCSDNSSGDHASSSSSSSSAKNTAASAAQPPFGHKTFDGFFQDREKTQCDATLGEETKGCCAGGRGSSVNSQRGPYITHSPGYRSGIVGHGSLKWDRWAVPDDSFSGESIPGESGFPCPVQANSSTTLGADVAAHHHYQPSFSSALPPIIGSVGVGSSSAARPEADLSSSALSADAKYYAARHGGAGLGTGPGEASASASAGSSGVGCSCAPPLGGFIDPGSNPLVVLHEVHQLTESVRLMFSRQQQTDMLTTHFLLSKLMTTQQAIRFLVSVYPLVPDLLSICKAFQRLNLTEDRKRRL